MGTLSAGHRSAIALLLASSMVTAIASCSSDDAPSGGAPDAGGADAKVDASSPIADGASPGSDSAPPADGASPVDSAPIDTGLLPDGAPVTTPVISAIAAIVASQNTIAKVDVDKAFTVTDPGGVDGIIVTAVAADPAHVVLGTPSCTAGACTIHVQVAPSVAGSTAVTLTAKNPAGGTGTGSINVAIAPHVVTSNADAGPTTLRAILMSSAAGDVITFDPSITSITFATELAFTQPLSIIGPGASALTLDFAGSYQGLMTYGAPAIISGLTVKNAHIGLVAFSGKVVIDKCAFTSNLAFGLALAAGNGNDATGVVTNSTFTSNGGNGAIAYFSAGAGTATLDVTGSTFTGNANGITAATSAAGQTALLHLNGGNTIQSNTTAGVVLEIDNALGAVGLSIPGTGGAGTNVITANPVGILRSGPVPSSAITIAPTSQVTANTADFTPAWP